VKGIVGAAGVGIKGPNQCVAALAKSGSGLRFGVETVKSYAARHHVFALLSHRLTVSI